MKLKNPVLDGNTATLYWQGSNPPRVISDLHNWEDDPRAMKRIEKNLWGYSMHLPVDAYVEYAFYNPRTRQRFTDPLNPNSIFNGFGHDNNFFYMHEAAPPKHAIRNAAARHGHVTRHLLDAGDLADNSKRSVYLYQPAVSSPTPLLVVYDGVDYLKRAKLNVIVDNMIHEKRIRPISIAFLQNGGEYRSVEYACSDAVILWLDGMVLPFAQKKLNLLDIKKHPASYGILGASFGGLMSLYTGLRMPETFGKVICQSGVFALEGRDFSAVELIRAKQSRGTRIWMDIGRFDWLLEDNRRMQPILQEHGYDIVYREFSGGHNYTCWRDEIPIGLEYLFGS